MKLTREVCRSTDTIDIEISLLFLVVTFVLLIAREDEQLLFRLFIDDNDEKVVGANHLRASVHCTFRFIAASLYIHSYTQL
jgi:hypothetical protein